MASQSIRRKYYQNKLAYKFISVKGPSFKYPRRYFYNHKIDAATIVFYAMENGDIKTLKQLVQYGRSVNISDPFGNGQFHVAVALDREEVLEYLLSVDTRAINQQNSNGETALFQAIRGKKYHLAETLILAGADVNIRNRYDEAPLQWAVSAPKIAHLLIECGADIDHRDVHNQTALHCAVYENSLETVCMLLYYNADTNVVTNYDNSTAFMVAIEYGYNEIEEALFEYTYDYDLKNTSDLSVLGLAITYKSTFAEEMIYRGANVNKMNGSKFGPLFLILRFGGSETSVNIKLFKLVWSRMNYEALDKSINECSVFEELFEVDSESFADIIDIFIETDKFSVVSESLAKYDDLDVFTLTCIRKSLALEKYASFFCKLMNYGYSPTREDMHIIYTRWGYCDLYKILLHMNIRSKFRSFCQYFHFMPSLLMYDIKCDKKEVFQYLIKIINKKEPTSYTVLASTMFRLLDHFIDPTLNQTYISVMKPDIVTMKINALPKVPSLLELARNKTREHIENSYQVTNSSQLYSLINSLNIAPAYKEILTFETCIYNPVFSQEKFRTFVTMSKILLNQRIMCPIVESVVFKNCILK